MSTQAIPFEEWLDGWLREHPEVRDYDREAMRDAFRAGDAYRSAMQPDAGECTP